jgi:hypothetical protein
LIWFLTPGNRELLAIIRGKKTALDRRTRNAVRLLEAILAAAIVKALERDKLLVLDAEKLTGAPYAKLSHIRRAKIGRVTIDKLIERMGMNSATLMRDRDRLSLALGGANLLIAAME